MFSLSSNFLLSSLLIASSVDAWSYPRAYPSTEEDLHWQFGRATETAAQINGCSFDYHSPGYYLNVSDSNVQINQGSVSNQVTQTVYSKIGVDPGSLRVNTMDTKFTTFNGTSSADAPGAYGFVSARQQSTHTSTLDLSGTNFIFDRATTMASYNQIVDGNSSSPHQLDMSSDNKRITLTVTAVTDKAGDYSDFWIDHVQLTCIPPNNAPPGYKINFSNLSARTVDDSHSIGKSFSDSESGCRAQCNSKDNCQFVNTYRNVPSGASDASRWTCAFYSACSSSKAATDKGKGGRTIKQSSGYCKT